MTKRCFRRQNDGKLKEAATETVLEALTQIAIDLGLEVAELDYHIGSEQFLNEMVKRSVEKME